MIHRTIARFFCPRKDPDERQGEYPKTILELNRNIQEEIYRNILDQDEAEPLQVKKSLWNCCSETKFCKASGSPA